MPISHKSTSKSDINVFFIMRHCCRFVKCGFELLSSFFHASDFSKRNGGLDLFIQNRRWTPFRFLLWIEISSYPALIT